MAGSDAGTTDDSPRSLWDGTRRWLRLAIDLLFPPRCPICLAEPSGGQESVAMPPSEGLSPDWSRAIRGGAASGGVCGPCLKQLAGDAARCPRCGAVSPPTSGCQACRKRPGAWRHMVVLSAYSGGLREAVLRAKRPSGEPVAAALGEILWARHREAFAVWGIDRVVPVPMHWMRRAWRGTSAADGLARAIGRCSGLPWARAIQRRRATRMQNEFPAELRAENVRAAFRARRPVPGARVLLVDDVVTTGATLSACSRVLLEAGAASVDVAVVARADRNETTHPLL